MPQIELGAVNRSTIPGTRKTEASAYVRNFDGGPTGDTVVVSAWRPDQTDRRVAEVFVSYMMVPGIGDQPRLTESDRVLVRAGSLDVALNKGGKHFGSELNTNPKWTELRTRIKG